METQTVKQTQVLFEEHVQLTGIKEFGLSWDDLNEGKVSLPQQGARFDISFEGELKGPGIEGKIKGVDYLTIRADGRFMLRIHATVITRDGESIALEEDGILIPDTESPSYADLQFNMKFTTASPKYSWLNNLPVWGVGHIDRAMGSVYIRGYSM
ncbi:MAG: DUF3237 family protein [Cyclobacteriaceae bacterium]|nr:DUF3237 family protein [Cyclobacteriaceae bacterium]